MITLQQIRVKIIEAVKQSGCTQAELSRRLGVCQQTVSHYVRGNKMPALDTLANLCAILDVDANDILCVGQYGEN